MSSNRELSRAEKIKMALLNLDRAEKRKLEMAADSHWHGGDRIEEPLAAKAATLGLAFRCSGRLRMDVYNILQSDEPLLIG